MPRIKKELPEDDLRDKPEPLPPPTAYTIAENLALIDSETLDDSVRVLSEKENEQPLVKKDIHLTMGWDKRYNKPSKFKDPPGPFLGIAKRYGFSDKKHMYTCMRMDLRTTHVKLKSTYTYLARACWVKSTLDADN